MAYSNLHTYWSPAFLGANGFILLNLLGALLLGMLVGYERTFRGRAAGMRTYGLVCMTSAGLTVLVGLPGYWYGGHSSVTGGDPTRVIQGVVTGIGFLGAGVIMKDGFHISGLTTAASIWTSAAIGIMLGAGFYAAAILLALVCTISMEWVRSLERWLPNHPILTVTVLFKQGFVPKEETLCELVRGHGYTVALDSLCISHKDGQPEWHFNAVGTSSRQGVSSTQLAGDLSSLEGVTSFSVAPNKG
ncbi:MgtC/SapB family protein [Aquabacterium sp.]|uniref:MgtC/SapB family protein n=1 Tax=Aquabacterium sp. TaxID=1872578 RepID=UPI0025C3B324|nr:MgtC/SapB family protein [Aquabacterium sp.]